MNPEDTTFEEVDLSTPVTRVVGFNQPVDTEAEAIENSIKTKNLEPIVNSVSDTPMTLLDEGNYEVDVNGRVVKKIVEEPIAVSKTLEPSDLEIVAAPKTYLYDEPSQELTPKPKLVKVQDNSIRDMFGEEDVTEVNLEKINSRYYELQVQEKAYKLLLNNPWMLDMDHMFLTNISMDNASDQMLSKFIANDLSKILTVSSSGNKGYSLYEFTLEQTDDRYRLFLNSNKRVRGDTIRFPLSLNAKPVDISRPMDEKNPFKEPVATNFGFEGVNIGKIFVGEYALPFLSGTNYKLKRPVKGVVKFYATYMSSKTLLSLNRQENLNLEMHKRNLPIYTSMKDLTTKTNFDGFVLSEVETLLDNYDMGYTDDERILEIDGTFYYVSNIKKYSLYNLFRVSGTIVSKVNIHTVKSTIYTSTDVQGSIVFKMTFPKKGGKPERTILYNRNEISTKLKLQSVSKLLNGLKRDMYDAVSVKLVLPTKNVDIYAKLNRMSVKSKGGRFYIILRTDDVTRNKVYQRDGDELTIYKDKKGVEYKANKSPIIAERIYIYKSLTTNKLLIRETDEGEYITMEKVSESTRMEIENYNPILFNIKQLMPPQSYKAIFQSRYKLFETGRKNVIGIKLKHFMSHEIKLQESVDSLNFNFGIDTKSDIFNILQMISPNIDMSTLCYKATIDQSDYLYNSVMNPINSVVYGDPKVDFDRIEFFVEAALRSHMSANLNRELICNMFADATAYLAPISKKMFNHIPNLELYEEDDEIELIKELAKHQHH